MSIDNLCFMSDKSTQKNPNKYKSLPLLSYFSVPLQLIYIIMCNFHNN
ncbi:hypothetical protein HMPREF0673_01862 [Leyella stercorea DSM 18206]|uniref:Uncharacterized protein n=1 Tax=Leyella stercorea DSM 18206 TaxID=1002367 RepID=G6AYZ9_9BACT|nr:hypothetical protein HMPREF0673_01862 [Leyella stercorea DSM 18206]